MGLKIVKNSNFFQFYFFNIFKSINDNQKIQAYSESTYMNY